MAREEFRVVVPTFWTDPEVKRKLTRDQKHLALYYFTSPHSKGSMTGVYYCPVEYASSEADLTVTEIRSFLVGPIKPFVTYDEETEEIFVHSFAKHNVGSELRVGEKGEDNRIPAIRRQVEAIHSPRLRRAFLLKYNEAFQLGMTIPVEAPSEPLPRPSEAISCHPIPSQDIAQETIATQSADAGRTSHNQGSCMALIVDRLYFGNRPPPADLASNGSILRNFARLHGFDRMASIIEGLALRRDRGELHGVGPRETVSLKWLNSAKMDLNQLAVSEDAVYRSAEAPRGKPGVAGLGAIIGNL